MIVKEHWKASDSWHMHSRRALEDKEIHWVQVVNSWPWVILGEREKKGKKKKSNAYSGYFWKASYIKWVFWVSISFPESTHFAPPCSWHLPYWGVLIGILKSALGHYWQFSMESWVSVLICFFLALLKRVRCRSGGSWFCPQWQGWLLKFRLTLAFPLTS